MSDLASTVFSVIMVGHSLFGTTGPDMLDAALGARSATVRVDAQIINGAPLKYNWDHSDDAQGVDARAVLPRGRTTDLILTEAVPLANHLKWSDTGAFAAAFAALALEANPDTRIFVQETWHSLKSGTGEAVAFDEGADVPWRARLADDLDDWESIIAILRDDFPQAASGIELIPAGQALAHLAGAIDAGEIPGLRGVDQLFEDDIHPNALGHYFISMVQFAVLTHTSPEGLPHVVKNRFGQIVDGPDAQTAQAMQRVARAAVETYTGRDIAQASAVPRAPPIQTAQTQLAIPEHDNSRSKAARPIAVGLAPVTDWAAQQPFLDVMKTARPWLGHLAGRYGGVEYADLVAGGHVDAQGWIASLPRDVGSVGTMILTDLPEAAAASLGGRYVLRFEGSGIVEAAGRATNVRYGRNELEFDFTPGPGSVEIRIQRSSASNPVRRISVVRKDRVAQWQGGAIFNPDFLDRLAPFNTLRMMDWMQTNNSKQSKWQNRPQVTDASWAHHGVPLEVMLELANQQGKNLWLNIPHLAEDEYVENFAQHVRRQLHPRLKVYVEFSNEVWNFQFEQTRWAEAQAQAQWGQADVGTQYYAQRAAEVARIWSGVFEGTQGQLINVISTQTGWLGLEENILAAPLAVAQGAPAPVTAFDAYAVTGYFGGVLGLQERGAEVSGWLDESLARAEQAAISKGLNGDARAAEIEATQYDYATALAGRELLDGSVSGQTADTVRDLRTRVWPYHADVARKAGLDMIMYEGGTHVVGIGPQVEDARLTAFFHHLNYSAEMGALYAQLLAAWSDVGGTLFNAYADIYVPTKWGSWGVLRHLDDSNPRWDALVAGQ